jgi:hypothetical protein
LVHAWGFFFSGGKADRAPGWLLTSI